MSPGGSPVCLDCVHHVPGPATHAAGLGTGDRGRWRRCWKTCHPCRRTAATMSEDLLPMSSDRSVTVTLVCTPRDASKTAHRASETRPRAPETRIPRCGDSTPCCGDPTPRCRDSIPRSDDPAPRCGDSTPCSGDSTPRSNDPIPSFRRYTPRSARYTRRARRPLRRRDSTEDGREGLTWPRMEHHVVMGMRIDGAPSARREQSSTCVAVWNLGWATPRSKRGRLCQEVLAAADADGGVLTETVAASTRRSRSYWTASSLR
jgi:hypothetical protein